MLELPNVTLLFVATRGHELTKYVIEDTMAKARFGDVLIYTDRPGLIPILKARYELVPDFPNKEEAGRFYYGQAMAKVETDFALLMEWDGGIYDPTKWKPEFFNYDYIGAPWFQFPGNQRYDVGNGGFTLMSKRLGDFVYKNLNKWPVSTDWNFCRTQRAHYEAAGFKWPDRNLASYFAWELGPRNPEHFGYHGTFTWPLVMAEDEVVHRFRMMLRDPYLKTKMDHRLQQAAPWLPSKLTPEELAIYRGRPMNMHERRQQLIANRLNRNRGA